MTVQKIITILTKMLSSKNWKVNFRCNHITKVDIYYDDDIILTIKDGKISDVEKR